MPVLPGAMMRLIHWCSCGFFPAAAVTVPFNFRLFAVVAVTFDSALLDVDVVGVVVRLGTADSSLLVFLLAVGIGCCCSSSSVATATDCSSWWGSKVGLLDEDDVVKKWIWCDNPDKYSATTIENKRYQRVIIRVSVIVVVVVCCCCSGSTRSIWLFNCCCAEGMMGSAGCYAIRWRAGMLHTQKVYVRCSLFRDVMKEKKRPHANIKRAEACRCCSVSSSMLIWWARRGLLLFVGQRNIKLEWSN